MSRYIPPPARCCKVRPGSAIGAVAIPTGATAAFGIINKMPFVDRAPVAGVGDEAARIDQIKGVAARAGDRGVLVFVRGGSIDDDRRYEAASEVARWALSGSVAPAETTGST